MFIAERQGFEPRVPRSTTVFKTAAIDHSATSPKLLLEVLCFSKAMQRYSFFLNTQNFKLFFSAKMIISLKLIENHHQNRYPDLFFMLPCTL